jgi:hypothetical protein
MSIIVIFSLVFAYRSFRSDDPGSPSYYNAAPKAVSEEPDNTIVDLGLVQNPPIKDEDFAFLHQKTKLIASFLLEKPRSLVPLMLRSNVLSNELANLREYRTIIGKDSQTRSEKVRFNFPRRQTCELGAQLCRRICKQGVGETQPVCLQTSTGQNIRYSKINPDGSVAPSLALSVNLLWIKTRSGWRVFELDTRLLGNTNNSNTDQGVAPK